MKYKLVLLYVLLLLGKISLAQSSNSLTLKAAINLSFTNSKYLYQNKVAIDKAAAALLEAKQNKLPNASISGSYLQLSQANVDLKLKSNNTSGQPTEVPK
jgi:outer membrane protein TolC